MNTKLQFSEQLLNLGKQNNTMSLEESSPIESRNEESESETRKLSFHNACAQGNLKVVKVYLARLGFDMNVLYKTLDSMRLVIISPSVRNSKNTPC